MNREEITNNQDYKATKVALEWWKSLPLEVRREQEKQPDIIDAYSDGVIYGWNNPNWISVEDELPIMQDNEWRSDDVFFVTDNGQRHYGFYIEDGDVWFSSVIGFFRTSEVTHWMPLPQLPRKEE